MALIRQGKYTQAIEEATKALALAEKTFGPVHPNTATSLNELANTYTHMGAYVTALPLYERALAIREKVLGPDNPDTGVSLNNLALLYRNMGDYAKALPLARRALAITEKAEGPDHPSTGIRLNNLALLHQDMGDYAKALPLTQRALAISEKANGPDHPDTGVSLNNLALQYGTLGDYAKALPLAQRALAISEKAEGLDHPSTGIRLNNLAWLNKEMGDYAKALPLTQRALAISEKANGPDHPSTAMGLGNLAIVYMSMGDYIKALPLAQRALTISEKASGPDHPDTGSSLNNLALLYRDMGDYPRALPLYERALAISEKAVGPDHPSTAIGLNHLTLLHQDMGDYAKALLLAQRALAISEKALGPDHPSTAMSLNNLALLLQIIGDYAKALPLFQRALAISEKTEGPGHPSTAVGLNNLALLHQTVGDYTKAVPLFIRALAIREKVLGPDHPDTGGSLNNLAFLYKDMGDYTKAVPLFLRALAINEKALGPDHPSTGTTLNNLALLHQDMGEYANALSLYHRSILIVAKAGNPDHLHKLQGNLSFFHAKASTTTAIFWGKAAVNTIQSMRGGMARLDRDLQKSFLAKEVGTYRFLIKLLVKEGRTEEALQVQRMLKEDEYFDFTRTDAGIRRTRAELTPREAKAARPFQDLVSQLGALGSERKTLGALKNPTEIHKARMAELDRELARLGTAFQACLTDITDTFAQPEKDPTPFHIQETLRFQKSLNRGTVAIYTVTGEDGLNLILVGSDRIQAFGPTPLPRKDLEALVVAFRRGLDRPGGAYEASGLKLYQHLVAPLEKDLAAMGAKTLLWSLDGALRYVPVAAIPDGKGFLAQRWTHVLLTPAAELALGQETPKDSRLLGCGVSKAHENLPALPGVRDELRALVKQEKGGLLPGSLRLDEAFTATELQARLKEGYPLVHLASHFVFQPGNDTQSYLLLGDGQHLTLANLREIPEVFRGVDLLVLSACQTGLGGKDKAGMEVEGFGVLAQRQGARAALASLWPVADASTSAFMQAFYRTRVEGRQDKAEALRQTQVAMIEGRLTPTTWSKAQRGVVMEGSSSASSWSHPFYWAPFILMGNWR